MVKNYLYIFITAVAVSVDSLFAGFGVSLNRRKSAVLPVIVAVITLVLCLLALFAGKRLAGFLPESTIKYIGCVVLIAIGVADMAKCEAPLSVPKGVFAEAVAVGFAVGFDAAVANLSLALMGFDTVAVPVFFALMHLFTVNLGQHLAHCGKFAEMENTNLPAGGMLVLLGILKAVF